MDDFAPLTEALADAYFIGRYLGFDLDDPDWPLLKQHLETAGRLLEIIRSRGTRKEV